MFEVEIVSSSLIGCTYVHNGVNKRKKGCKLECLQPFNSLSGAYRNRTDDLLTARDNMGFSTGLHYTLLHYITIIINSCFSYILHLFSFWLANNLANFEFYVVRPTSNLL